MQRWLAVLMLGSLLSARLMVLVCPTMHHGESSPHVQAAGHAGHHSLATVPEPERSAESLPHGDETTCAMLLTCTTPALIGPAIALFAPMPENDVRSPMVAHPSPDPLSAGLTPPPRLG